MHGRKHGLTDTQLRRDAGHMLANPIRFEPPVLVMGRPKNHGVGRGNIHGNDPTKHAGESRQLDFETVRDGKGAIAAMQAGFPS